MLPAVIRWDTFPLDISDPLKRFKLSRFNYLHKDPEAGLVAGFWEAEAGQEVVGTAVGGGVADELMIVLEGRLYVSAPGEPEQVAEAGDVIAAMHDRETHIVARERARAFFIAWRLDVGEAERVMRGAGA